mmetsp:Transcript_47505/g.152562  ORF Transcript_47505/g.152562 Transcript_47505/m.152562 type:complete len:208 (-) Transcript_47505:181-804(-)
MPSSWTTTCRKARRFSSTSTPVFLLRTQMPARCWYWLPQAPWAAHPTASSASCWVRARCVGRRLSSSPPSSAAAPGNAVRAGEGGAPTTTTTPAGAGPARSRTPMWSPTPTGSCLSCGQFGRFLAPGRDSQLGVLSSGRADRGADRSRRHRGPRPRRPGLGLCGRDGVRGGAPRGCDVGASMRRLRGVCSGGAGSVQNWHARPTVVA